VLLSGGIDSATALHLTRRAQPARALTFEYRGISRRELESARDIAKSARVVEHRLVRLPDLREAGEVPGFRLGALPPTYIPLRNSIFYSFAASVAEETGAGSIVGGHNRDDAEIFDDVGPRFFSRLQAALLEASPVLRKNKLRIVRPLRQKSKPQVVVLAERLRVPLELTWSCHRDGDEHCWSCPGCTSRIEAFRRAGLSDPLFHGEGKLLKQMKRRAGSLGEA
jgi:7-cyano-7-deazaguanine synthase